ncbi:glutamine--fructose-6-phosphate aminotransferase [Candidatus Gottesmanbacteria bacterium RBG_16_43_7]|uniref:Glutamine--fructose-6-phosphate aminotransferase [isomerizing] n=1 Tax=Candidatus Gottesmanbacteria bacterium RBG_16_43_7 TaxID=1798373 RepID=A0A1F5Z871_9BACT|nr:MAG: glutamine--fructose-6-phosphate aminotransferase [Candidatus Gottesmanbacteria bacterium RBG_16_43_7]
MCGIFGYVGKRKTASDLVLAGLKALEYRGYDSWGIAAVPIARRESKSKILVTKKTGHIDKIITPDLPPSHLALGHTRWATHGGVTDANAHPHLDCTGNLALIHNGIIENYLELKQKVLAAGHKLISDTDSEIAVHLIEEYCKTMMPTKAVQKAFCEITGLNAFIVLSLTDQRLIAVRNGSPLVVGFGTSENFVASDALALIPHTKQVHFMEDNQLALVSAGGIMLFNATDGREIELRKQKLDWSIEQTVKGNYPFYTLKEIYEQPAILADIAANYESTSQKLAEIIKKSFGSYLVGCGTAAHACMAGSYLFSALAKRHINWALGSEFGFVQDFLTPKSLVIALSQSGETMDTLDSVNKAHQKGARVFALVNVLGSTLYRVADYKTLIGAGPEKGVASTKAFTAKLAHLVMLSYALGGNVNQGKLLITQASKAVSNVLVDKNRGIIRALAKKIAEKQHLYVIGRGISYPIALEAALKIKEISYIHAEGLAGGELKHGPLALVEPGIPCLVFAPLDETYNAILAGAMEMKARGGYIIGISPLAHETFDYYIPVTDIGIATAIPNVVIAQLMAYELAIAHGLDPDKPRNLAKSVTVR